MKSDTLIVIGKIIALLIIALGLIHDVATFTPLIKGGLSCVHPQTLRAMTYMSLVCGSAFILGGLLILVMIGKLRQNSFVKTPVSIIGIFLAIAGILSVVYMQQNPFAWMVLVLNLGMFAVIIILNALIKHKN